MQSCTASREPHIKMYFWFVYVVIILVGLIQIPVLVDVLRALFPRLKLRRTTYGCANFILVAVMTSFFIIGLSYYLLLFLPLMVGNTLMSVRGILHLTFALWVWINIVMNYYMAVFVHPGKREEGDDDDDRVGQPSACVLEQEDEDVSNGMEWDPPNYHYCSICQETMVYMDHHCPFTGNCAGLKNYSYFLLTLMYGSVGLGYALWVSFPYFNQCSLAGLWWFLGLGNIDRPDVCSTLGPHVNIVLAVCGGFYITTNLSIIQVLLLLSDLSTYDILKNLTKLPVFRFAWHRIKGKKYKQPNSRLNILLLKQRPNLLWFLVPCMNTNDHVPLSVLTQE